MMQSKNPAEPLNTFEEDAPITRADSEAQWALRGRMKMTSKEYLDWCSWITRDAVSHARDFHTEPFEL